MLLKSVRTTPACLNTGKSPAGVQNGLFVLFWGMTVKVNVASDCNQHPRKIRKGSRQPFTSFSNIALFKEHLSEGRPREFCKG